VTGLLIRLLGRLGLATDIVTADRDHVLNGDDPETADSAGVPPPA